MNTSDIDAHTDERDQEILGTDPVLALQMPLELARLEHHVNLAGIARIAVALLMAVLEKQLAFAILDLHIDLRTAFEGFAEVLFREADGIAAIAVREIAAEKVVPLLVPVPDLDAEAMNAGLVVAAGHAAGNLVNILIHGESSFWSKILG